MRSEHAFTLVEILILIAMLCVLAAIGTSAGRNAFGRSKIAEERKKLQEIRVAMKNYFIDSAGYLAQPEYPVDAGTEDRAWSLLTTPVAYLNAIPRSNFYDAFSSSFRDSFRFWYWGGGAGPGVAEVYRQKFYLVTSSGPDAVRSLGSSDIVEINAFPPTVTVREGPNFRNRLYDPTNGVFSTGDFAATPDELYN